MSAGKVSLISGSQAAPRSVSSARLVLEDRSASQRALEADEIIKIWAAVGVAIQGGSASEA